MRLEHRKRVTCSNFSLNLYSTSFQPNMCNSVKQIFKYICASSFTVLCLTDSKERDITREGVPMENND